MKTSSAASFKVSEDLLTMIESSKNSAETIVDHLGGFFAVIGSDGRIMRSNINLATFMGVHFQDVIEKNLHEIFEPTDWQTFTTYIAKIIASPNQAQRFELPVKKAPDAKEFSNLYLWNVKHLQYPYQDIENLFIAEASFIGEYVSLQVQLKELNDDLESKVEARTKDLEKLHSRNLQLAHSAGMATVAANVLHSIGNGLTAVVVNNEIIVKDIELIESSLQFTLFEQAIHELKKIESLKDLCLKLQIAIKDQPKRISRIFQRSIKIKNNLDAVVKILKTQERYAAVGSYSERIDLSQIASDAVHIDKDDLDSAGINVSLLLDKDVYVVGQTNKFLTVILNLLRNAKEALLERSRDRLVNIHVFKRNQRAIIEISDNGPGMTSEVMKMCFNEGFTTKPGHEGYGLHIASNMIKESGGIITLANAENGGIIVSMEWAIGK